MEVEKDSKEAFPILDGEYNMNEKGGEAGSNNEIGLRVIDIFYKAKLSKNLQIFILFLQNHDIIKRGRRMVNGKIECNLTTGFGTIS
nr:hypothetical protein [uncultured Bacillus sp.]